jgi:hypothetical protein
MAVTISGSTPTFSAATGYAGGVITSGTLAATTSGTAFDFTSIPSWVKRITVMMYEVSTNGGSNLLVQLGTSGGIVSSGYLSTNAWFNNTTLGNGTDTTGMFASVTPSSSGLMSGIFTLTTLGSNIWVSTSITKQSTNQSCVCASSITLGGTLTQLRFTSIGGTNTFDNGSVNIFYE